MNQLQKMETEQSRDRLKIIATQLTKISNENHKEFQSQLKLMTKDERDQREFELSSFDKSVQHITSACWALGVLLNISNL